MEIKTKRAYDNPEPNDGIRILVDRLWPRGISKEDLAIEDWPKEIAPSNALRKWYSHDPEKWEEFKTRYYDELQDHEDIWRKLLEYPDDETVTLIYSSKEEKLNNAVALKEFLEARMEQGD